MRVQKNIFRALKKFVYVSGNYRSFKKLTLKVKMDIKLCKNFVNFFLGL